MTTTVAGAASAPLGEPPQAGPKPLTTGHQGPFTMIALGLFVSVPLLALVVAAIMSLSGGLSWGVQALIFGLNLLLYVIGGLGIGAGFHRYLTHGSFKAKRPLRIALAVAGTLAVEGEVIQWVADHRRHHAFSDREGDPHSPWRFGPGLWGLTKGFGFAHVGWFFRRETSNRERFAPDLLADRDIVRVRRLFPVIALTSLLLPVAVVGLVTWSLPAILLATFWSLARMTLLHHVTWSINSVCHIVGERPFQSRDHATNFWPLAILSFGESWHNLHHADPTCARHGVDPGQADLNARLIWAFQKLGWASEVRWPQAERLNLRRTHLPLNSG